MKFNRYKKITAIVITASLFCTGLLAGCGREPTALPSGSGVGGNAQMTQSPGNTQTPAPTVTPEPYYISTLDTGNGTYDFAWTGTCPISGPIAYGTTSEEVKALQQRLTNLGFWCGTINGTFNDRTLKALNDFQTVTGLAVTDSLDQASINLLYSSEGIEALTVEKSMIEKGSLTGKTVYIDAGHGGSAIGTAAGSLVEKNIVLEISYRLKEMLEYAGATVVMLRSDDSFESLTYRSTGTNYQMLQKTAEEIQDKIHQLENSAKDTIQEGSELSNGELESKLLELSSKIAQLTADYTNAESNKEEILTTLSALKGEYQQLEMEYNERVLNLNEYTQTDTAGNQIASLQEEYEEIMALSQLLIENITHPEDELTGILTPVYDENGYKVMNTDWERILDITAAEHMDDSVFISVHVNGVDNAPNVRGVEIYVRNSNDSTSNRYTHNRYYYLKYNTQVRDEFASAMLNQFNNVMPYGDMSTNVIKDSDFHVLREISIPTVLVEIGYCTNEAERIGMLTPQVRQDIAYAMALGVQEFYAE